MKLPKFILTAFTLGVALTAFSQETEVKKDVPAVHRWGIYPPPPAETTTNVTTEATNTLTFPAPNFGSYYIPVLGNFSSEQNNSGKNIVITGDEKNVGKVWIDGLTSERIYALLKATPGIYKIPNQKQAQEGILIYDDQTKQVNICLGCGYKDQNPEGSMANAQKIKSKNRKSILNYTGTKNEQGTVSTK